MGEVLYLGEENLLWWIDGAGSKKIISKKNHGLKGFFSYAFLPQLGEEHILYFKKGKFFENTSNWLEGLKRSKMTRAKTVMQHKAEKKGKNTNLMATKPNPIKSYR